MSSFANDCAEKALNLLLEAQSETDVFAKQTGIKCREGCGQCCLKPALEVQVVEMLPLARELIKNGEASSSYDLAAASPDGVCVFYAPESQDHTKGRCRHYALRPGICRLFGFAAVSTKESEHPALASCSWHKQLMPEAVKAAQRDINAGGNVPLFADYRMRMFAIAPTPSYSETLPINRALMQAIEKLELLSLQDIDPADK